MRTCISSWRAGFVSGIVASSALAGGVLFANPAVTRHYWNFEGASPYSDKVGEANAEVTQTTTVSLQTGHIGTDQSMRTPASVGGANDFARVSDASKLMVPGDGPFSMSGWFRMPSATANNRGIFDFSGNGGDGPQLLLTAANALNFRIDGLGAYNLVASIPGADVENDQWHFFAAVYDPSLETGTLKFYLNASTPSATANRGTVEATSVAFDANCWLGTFNFTGSRENKGLDGMLDELACYAGLLTPAQIQLLFDKEITPLDLAPLPFIVTSYTRDAGTGESTVVWNSEIGQSYNVLGCDDLVSWTELNAEPIPGTGAPIGFQHTPPGNPDRYFFRIEKE